MNSRSRARCRLECRRLTRFRGRARSPACATLHAGSDAERPQSDQPAPGGPRRHGPVLDIDDIPAFDGLFGHLVPPQMFENFPAAVPIQWAREMQTKTSASGAPL